MSSVDIQRIERLVRDLIKEFGLDCNLVRVHTQDNMWKVLVRHADGREVEFDVLYGPPAQVRESMKKHLEIEC